MQQRPISENQQSMSELRDSLLLVMHSHEAQDHGGKPCPGHRVSAIAFLAHSLGIHSLLAWDAVQRVSQDYAAECANCPHLVIDPADEHKPMIRHRDRETTA